MSKKDVVSQLIELKNQGIRIHLTEEGWSVLIKVMSEGYVEETIEDQVG